MTKRTYILTVGILIGLVMPALILLMSALSQLTRWSGHTEVLPYVILIVLMLVGSLITGSVSRRRITR